MKYMEPLAHRRLQLMYIIVARQMMEDAEIAALIPHNTKWYNRNMKTTNSMGRYN